MKIVKTEKTKKLLKRGKIRKSWVKVEPNAALAWELDFKEKKCL